MKLFLVLLLTLAVALLAARERIGFGSQRPERYADTGPKLALAQHLAGPLVSEGVIHGPLGNVRARFVARMSGEWNAEGGVLREHFVYADSGETQQREWTVAFGEGGRFSATAPDIVGEATGRLSGSTARMQYRLRLPERAGGHVLDVTDWLYLLPNGTIVNRSEMRKFGIRVAELAATIRPDKNP